MSRLNDIFIVGEIRIDNAISDVIAKHEIEIEEKSENFTNDVIIDNRNYLKVRSDSNFERYRKCQDIGSKS